ncbi:MAG: hypothetical protein AAFY76_11075, partial [Cyanobacteria bacterium J06649_11]
SKYLVMFAFSTGFFPGYLEEPLSMLFIAFVIGLNYQEQKKQMARAQPKARYIVSNLHDSKTL